MDIRKDVTDFHKLVGQPVADKPTSLPKDRVVLRLRLIAEEVTELVVALAGMNPENRSTAREMVFNVFQEVWDNRDRDTDLAETLDAACDSIYVIMGTLVEMGLPFEPAWNEVQRANMSKAGGPKDRYGKALRPLDWMPPDIETVVEDAMLDASVVTQEFDAVTHVEESS